MADAVEQSLLLPRDMVDLRSMRWHEDLLGPEGGLDSLKRMGSAIKKKKKWAEAQHKFEFLAQQVDGLRPKKFKTMNL